MQPPSAILRSSSKKFLYFLIFQKVELCRSNIKNFLIFQETSYISGSNFPSFEMKLSTDKLKVITTILN